MDVSIGSLDHSSPRDLTGLDPICLSLDGVARLVGVEHGAAPSVVVAAQRHDVRGAGTWGAERRTPFDLASVTKPFVALALTRLERKGVLSRKEALGTVVPALGSTKAGSVSLDLLAAHRSGLEAHQKLYAPLERGETVEPLAAVAAAANAMRPDCSGPAPPDGFPPIYSDMGYLLLGVAIETRCGRPLDEVVGEEVLLPLGLEQRVGSARQMRALDPSFLERVAPTENIPFRGGVVRGLVHDENAFAITRDGLAGHAGLFGDADSVLELGLEILKALRGESDWLSAADLAPVLRRRPGGTLLAGFDSKSKEAPSSGARLGPATFGHLGFTGTSLWIDPEAAFAGVLLTNRVHPTREHIAIRAARPVAYDAMFDALG